MTDPHHPARLPGTTMGAALGFDVTKVGDERASGRFEVTDAVRQPMGAVHGGAMAAMAEELVSVATLAAVEADGQVALGQSSHVSFLRPVGAGVVRAEARRRHRGRTSWIWDVDLTDDEGALCAVARVTLAVRQAAG